MKNRIYDLFLKKGFLNWATRLISIIIAGASVDQVLVRFKIDILNILSADLIHYLLICVIISLMAELSITINSLKKVPQLANITEPRNDFGKAVLMYIRYLKSINKHSSVVDLRNKLTHLFHLLGLNTSREEMGKIALESAVVIKDYISKAEILIDDIGWAIHLQGRTTEARNNLYKAIELLEHISIFSDDDKIRINLAHAKAYRHLAFLVSEKEKQIIFLNKCIELINLLKNDPILLSKYQKSILCDEAQIFHARAFLIARNIGIHIEGYIQLNEKEDELLTREALSEVKKAITIFFEIGDMEREAKALVLQERLHSALREEIEAIETRARREMVITNSGIDGSITVISLGQSILKTN